jgi:hypothetical protein
MLELRIGGDLFFADAIDHGPPGTFGKLFSKGRQGCGRADGVDLNAPVAKIPYKARQAESLGQSHDKIAKAHALDHSADEIAPGDFLLWHGRFGSTTANAEF